MKLIYWITHLLHRRERERARAGGAAEGEGEADSPLSREPDAGQIPGPWDHDPKQKAGAQLTEPPRRPTVILNLSWKYRDKLMTFFLSEKYTLPISIP